MDKIPFNKPYFTGKEVENIQQAIASTKISGDGIFTKKCHEFFEKKYRLKKALLTTSCTDALEMAAILLDIKEGDEVIVPSFTFVSTVNAFILRGAKIIFANSYSNNPNMDADTIESLITKKTKVIVPVHYAGVACDMDKIMQVAKQHNLFVVEDAAQAIDSFYTGADGKIRALGSIGHLAAFSFHETKNIISGEGGLLVINDDRFVHRAEIIREKGTNRSAFFRGEVDKYGWVDIGSSFLPSDMIAAFLFAQLESMDHIQTKRKQIWNLYFKHLEHLQKDGKINLPDIPSFATNNAHMFYIVCKDLSQRTQLMEFLRNTNIYTAFHYQSLHASAYYSDKYTGPSLKDTDHYTDALLRLPFYTELEHANVEYICAKVCEFYK